MLIAKLDRCTRSVADLASLIDTFSRRGVALISAAESLDTSSAGGRLVVNVLTAAAATDFQDMGVLYPVTGAARSEGDAGALRTPPARSARRRRQAPLLCRRVGAAAGAR